MTLLELTKKKNLKTVIIILSTAGLFTLHRYLGSFDFFTLNVHRPSFFKDMLASSQYYRWSVAFVLYFIVPSLIIRIGFREKLRDYGLFIKKPLIALFVTLLGIAIVSPFLYSGSKAPEFIAMYPAAHNAGASGYLFFKSSLFYFFFYIGYEFLFRGYLFMGTKDDIGEWQAISVSTLATVILHMTTPVKEMAVSFLVGIVFPLIVKKFRSIWPVVFIHAYIGIAFDYWVIINSGGF
ncbi:MAG TPA: CPBP family intramembrane metalloprotease [Spirochaetes bacterium]|nr:CPBP family intramembrane metalloprotease [Spirochaetota bacterium]